MSFELIDNLLQVAVLGCAAIAAVALAVRYRDRRCLILAFAYASFSMGTLFYVLHLAILGEVPQVFYVSEISWLAAYLFFLSLQILRTEKLALRFTWPAAGSALLFAVCVIVFHIFGPSYLMSGLLAVTAGAAGYLSVFRLGSGRPFRQTDACMLACIVLQILLYVVSDFTRDYTRFGLYFAVDLLLTVLLTALLPLTLREVRAS